MRTVEFQSIYLNYDMSGVDCQQKVQYNGFCRLYLQPQNSVLSNLRLAFEFAL